MSKKAQSVKESIFRKEVEGQEKLSFSEKLIKAGRPMKRLGYDAINNTLGDGSHGKEKCSVLLKGPLSCFSL